MRKKAASLNSKIEEEILNLAKQMCEYDRRSVSCFIEHLILEEARKRKITEL